jgi:site-specific DNA-cytosine methylase
LTLIALLCSTHLRFRVAALRHTPFAFLSHKSYSALCGNRGAGQWRNTRNGTSKVALGSVAADAVWAQVGEAGASDRTTGTAAARSEDFSYPREWDASRITSSMRTDHTPLSQRRFKATGWGKIEPATRFLKLHSEGICNTLRAGTQSDRGAFTSPRPIHPYALRCITVREAALAFLSGLAVFTQRNGMAFGRLATRCRHC